MILGVNLRHQESSLRQVRRFLKEFPMPFPVLLDDKGKAQRDYTLGLLPVLVFIGSDGVIRKIENGHLTENQFNSSLRDILPAAP